MHDWTPTTGRPRLGTHDWTPTTENPHRSGRCVCAGLTDRSGAPRHDGERTLASAAPVPAPLAASLPRRVHSAHSCCCEGCSGGRRVLGDKSCCKLWLQSQVPTLACGCPPGQPVPVWTCRPAIGWRFAGGGQRCCLKWEPFHFAFAAIHSASAHAPTPRTLLPAVSYAAMGDVGTAPHVVHSLACHACCCACGPFPCMPSMLLRSCAFACMSCTLLRSCAFACMPCTLLRSCAFACMPCALLRCCALPCMPCTLLRSLGCCARCSVAGMRCWQPLTAHIARAHCRVAFPAASPVMRCWLASDSGNAGQGKSSPKQSRPGRGAHPKKRSRHEAATSLDPLRVLLVATASAQLK
eukprot:350420-Chlamydomonas_euryale.AAC.4